MTGASFPLLSVFLEMLFFFIFIMWLVILFQVVVALFRSHDSSGGMKALWFLFLVLLPYLGVFIYLIARGSKMHERQVGAAKQQEQQMANYIREVAMTPADEVAKLHDLLTKGAITEAEFAAAKAKIIGQ